MHPDVKRAAIQNFKATRNEFVVELEKFSGGDPGGRLVPQIQTYLRQLFNTISMWTLIRKDSDQQGKCFEKKCENLMVLTDEISASTNFFATYTFDGIADITEPVLMKMFDMLAMQVGSLTLHGWSDEDDESVQNARMAEQEQHRWEKKVLGEDDERCEILRHLWGRFYYKDQDCDCRQCMDFYLPTREPTPSPSLPPIILEDSESEWYSSLSEEE
ncbi:hypothetical protein Pdw03_7059 [Penicillium digitatum]|uniref:Uncharacterized protein n=3 Tax=Penicillium digitatum TaxID=36651 RepID=K9FYW6_PEND2|nr:hypothetical protein PDIP_52830 [Penicillium digitatum Pd1]EKV12136.1 hypothetical protein PDIP_52830 [Penicillium digitatum Pd1]EKV14309.1 hypothetical protein PDIG_33250 [Penicillium digitatum PHI26]KAG0156042.1 hypothetical protein PDIDSM_3218 [Penicillium digitatum]QQK43158.1 hypothetical protein Pdw03_7059 [Penicillium digitatum]